MTTSITSLLTFVAATGLAMASPGPTIAALLARVLSRGTRGMPAFCTGLIIGDTIWFGATVFGLAVLAQAAQPVFAAARYAGAAYLLWLAYKMWTAPTSIGDAEAIAPKAEGFRLFGTGLALALGNPKTMIFYLALVPALIDLANVSGADFIVFETAIILVFTAVLTTYVVLADKARRLVKSRRAVKRVNRATGTVMAGAAVLVATR